ncbi:MAG: hypothetical protein CSA34_06790 [Desulfobulbus propionicus]|nr:MAG: hypothetical protein CSA34_06790 [Desulfobulbus propionicus]
MAQRTGIVGVPPLDVIRELNREGDQIIDLDEPQVHRPMDLSAPYIPRVYCAILRTVVLNAMHLQLDRIFIDVGPGKCDCALHVSEILSHLLPCPVIRTHNQDTQAFGTPLCTSGLPLIEKVTRITRGVQTAVPGEKPPHCPPVCGFWGVPPRDFSILELFPDATHIYGWTRCMENKTPADLELEKVMNPAVPTVFFAQSFCAKSALAKHLAGLHPRALYVDVDVTAGNSAKAKIEAFIQLAGLREG